MREQAVRDRVRKAIEDVEAAENLQEVPNVKKVVGHRGHYRIRIGKYRLGIARKRDAVAFVRCLHRREIYRYFP